MDAVLFKWTEDHVLIHQQLKWDFENERLLLSHPGGVCCAAADVQSTGEEGMLIFPAFSIPRLLFNYQV